HEREEKGYRERAGRDRIGDHHLHPPGLEVLEELDERRHVEVVVEDLAVRLEDERERVELPGDTQQVGAATSLQPKRCPRPGPPSREEQRTTRSLPKASAEQRRPVEMLEQEVFHLLRSEEQFGGIGGRVGV